MSAASASGTEHANGGTECWCCGRTQPQSRLLRLGARPEAAVCIDCAAHLHHRARAHDGAPGVAHRLHDAANRVRDVVMRTGLHRQPVIGSALRWVNRRSRF